MSKPAAERSERKARSAALLVTQKWVSEVGFVDDETWHTSVMVEELLGMSDVNEGCGGMGVVVVMVMTMVAYVGEQGQGCSIRRRTIAPA